MKRIKQIREEIQAAFEKEATRREYDAFVKSVYKEKLIADIKQKFTNNSYNYITYEHCDPEDFVASILDLYEKIIDL